MARNVVRTGKQNRPKTAIRGKRLHCAICRKRSPQPVKTPAPWYCPACLDRAAARYGSVNLASPTAIIRGSHLPASD